MDAQTVRRWIIDEFFQDCAGLEVLGPLFQSANGRLYKVIGPALPYPLAVKVCLRGNMGKPSVEDARQQYAALSRVKSAMPQSSTWRVPIAFPILLDRGGLVMEWVEAPTLYSIWTDWLKPLALVERRTMQAGEWLRHFHQAHYLPDGCLDTNDLLDRLKREFSGSGFRPQTLSLRGRAMAALARTAEIVNAGTVRTSWVHGDFKAGNVLITESGAIGIDIALRHEAPVVIDVAQFLIDMHLNCLEPAALRLAPARMRLERAFLAGYGAESDRAFQASRLWVQLLFLLRKYLEITSLPSFYPKTLSLKARVSFLLPQVIRQLETAVDESP